MLTSEGEKRKRGVSAHRDVKIITFTVVVGIIREVVIKRKRMRVSKEENNNFQEMDFISKFVIFYD